MPYVILTRDRADAGDLRAQVRDEHLAYLDANVDKLLAAGAMIDDDGTGGHGGVIIVDTDDRDEAEAFILEIEAQLTRIEVESMGRPRIRVFAPIWKGPWMSFNQDTYFHHVLDAVGADNVCSGLEDRYPVITDAALAELRPDLVLLPSEPYEFDFADQTELLRCGAFPGCQVLLVDGRDYTWHGSRTGRALGRIHDFLLRHRRPKQAG